MIDRLIVDRFRMFTVYDLCHILTAVAGTLAELSGSDSPLFLFYKNQYCRPIVTLCTHKSRTYPQVKWFGMNTNLINTRIRTTRLRSIYTSRRTGAVLNSNRKSNWARNASCRFRGRWAIVDMWKATDRFEGVRTVTLDEFVLNLRQ